MITSFNAKINNQAECAKINLNYLNTNKNSNKIMHCAVRMIFFPFLLVVQMKFIVSVSRLEPRTSLGHKPVLFSH